MRTYIHAPAADALNRLSPTASLAASVLAPSTLAFAAGVEVPGCRSIASVLSTLAFAAGVEVPGCRSITSVLSTSAFAASKPPTDWVVLCVCVRESVCVCVCVCACVRVRASVCLSVC